MILIKTFSYKNILILFKNKKQMFSIVNDQKEKEMFFLPGRIA